MWEQRGESTFPCEIEVDKKFRLYYLEMAISTLEVLESVFEKFRFQ